MSAISVQYFIKLIVSPVFNAVGTYMLLNILLYQMYHKLVSLLKFIYTFIQITDVFAFTVCFQLTDLCGFTYSLFYS